MRQFRTIPMLIFGVSLLFAACRKKIDHQPGVESSIEPFWVKVEVGLPSNIHSMELFNGDLYIGGSEQYIVGNGTPPCLVKMNINGNISAVTSAGIYMPGSSDPEIRDLQVFNNELFAAGDFYYNFNGQSGRGLVKFDFNDTPSEVASPGINRVNELLGLNTHIIIAGQVTGGVQKYSADSATVFTAQPNSPFTPNALGGTGNAVTIVGNNGDVAKSTIGSTGGWIDVNDSQISPVKDLYSIVRFGDDEYVTVESGTLLRHNTSTGQWSEFTVSGYSPGSVTSGGFRPKFKDLDGELYLLGNTGIHILRNNGQWEKFGTLSMPISDIVKFNGRFYASAWYGGLFVAPE